MMHSARNFTAALSIYLSVKYRAFNQASRQVEENHRLITESTSAIPRH